MRISDWSSDVCSSDLELALEDFHANPVADPQTRREFRLHAARDVVGMHLDHAADRLADAVRQAALVLDALAPQRAHLGLHFRSEEHTSELQSLMRISYAVFCLKKKKKAFQFNINAYVI